MKERPILFSGPMVRAILERRKTQTRRVIKPQPSQNDYQILTLMDSTAKEDRRHIGKSHWGKVEDLQIVADDKMFFMCPYGQPGDRLWVREMWTDRIDGNELPYCLYRADMPMVWDNDGEQVTLKEDDCKWRPSIHMPREVSRITLEIDEIRAERLQEISTDDIRSEGIVQRFPRVNDQFTPDILRGSFIELWDYTIKKADLNRYRFKANPWVWVIKFHRVEA